MNPVWLVVLAFLYTGHHTVVRSCHDEQCVAETEALAQQDPAVAGVKVYAPHTYFPLPESKLTPFPPTREWIKG